MSLWLINVIKEFAYLHRESFNFKSQVKWTLKHLKIHLAI